MRQEGGWGWIGPRGLSFQVTPDRPLWVWLCVGWGGLGWGGLGRSKRVKETQSWPVEGLGQVGR